MNGFSPQIIGLMVLAGKGFTINGIRLMDSVYIEFQYLTSYLQLSAWLNALAMSHWTGAVCGIPWCPVCFLVLGFMI